MSNPYITRKREQFDALKSTIEGVQTRAAEENRDLTEDELRSVQDQGEQAKKIAAEIESLSEIETRSAAVAKLAADVSEGEKRTTNAVVNHRDPGHYRSAEEGGSQSFFADMYRAKRMSDEGAQRRLTEHARALDATDGAGILPPKWLTEEYAELARQGRRVADAVRKLPISDARPITLPKQTAGTDAEVVEQSAENGATNFDDAFATGSDTLTPKATSGGQVFSRQLLDGTSPAIDSLVYGDLIAAYNAKVEAKVVAAIFAAGPTALEYDPAATAVDADHIASMVLKGGLAVRENRKAGATGVVMDVATYGILLDSKDTTGRPLMPTTGSSMNVVGVGQINVDGQVHGLGVLATDGVATADAGEFAAVRLSDVLLAESPVLRFYDEYSSGPESIRLAVWGYSGVLVRYSGSAVQVVAPAVAG